MERKESSDHIDSSDNERALFISLRNVFIELYNSEESARIITKDAGIDYWRIEWNGPINHVWERILTEARKHEDLVLVLLKKAKIDYPRNKDLDDAYDVYISVYTDLISTTGSTLLTKR